MSINFCVPTRGKPEWLDDFLVETIDKSRLPDTKFVVAIDEDETDKYKDSKLRGHEQVIWSIAPREDSLGAKFNRCAAEHPADLYIMGVDDLAIQTIAWDVHVSRIAELYEDGVGVINFGKQWNEPAMPAFQASTHRFVELQGFFMAPHFPFWWHDTWNLEMSRFIGRNLFLNMEVRYPTKEPPTPRRDINFWALFFDLTRDTRLETAKRMMKEMDIPPWRRYELHNEYPSMLQQMEAGNAKCRDPLWAMRFFDGRVLEGVEPRHERLLTKAQEILAQLNQEAKAEVEAVKEAA